MNKTKVLLVEDDELIAMPLINTLDQNNISLKWVGSAESAISELNIFNPDILLLDIGLPGMNGNELVKHIRTDQVNSKLRIIILTVETCENIKVGLLENGADDFISKPINYREISAKVKNFGSLRRVAKLNQDIEVGSLKLLHSDNSALVNDKLVRLTLTEYEILKLLLQNHGSLVTRENLFKSVWNNTEVTSKTIDAHIYSLRKKIPLDVGSIEVIRGRGFSYHKESA